MYIVDRIIYICIYNIGSINGPINIFRTGHHKEVSWKRNLRQLGMSVVKAAGIETSWGTNFWLRWWSLKQWLARALWHLSANIYDFDRFWPLLQHTVAMGTSHCLNLSNITNIYQCILDDFLKTHRPSPKKIEQSTQCQQWQIILAKHYYSEPSPSLP